MFLTIFLALFVLCLLVFFFFCWMTWNLPSLSYQRDVELGLRRSDVRPHLRTTRDMSSSRSLKSGYRRITEPEIKNGRLYGQDYFAIREHLTRTGTLFRDEKVVSVHFTGRDVICSFALSFPQTNTPSVTMDGWRESRWSLTSWTAG